MRVHITTILMVALGFTLGCDALSEEPAAEQAANSVAKVKQASEEKEAQPGVASAAETNKAAEIAASPEQQAATTKAVTAYATCAGECLRETGTKATDRATCQLTCKQALETTLARNPLQKAALATLAKIDSEHDTCVGECKSEKSADDRATCMLTCTSEVSERAKSMPLSLDAPKDAADPCAVACDAKLEMCSDKCKADKSLSRDNRATCNLHCREEANSCAKACELKSE